jgi:hypothetical protein
MVRMTKRQQVAVKTTLARLEHTLTIARSAAAGAEPELAAVYLADTLEDLGAELAVVRDVRGAVERSEAAAG